MIDVIYYSSPQSLCTRLVNTVIGLQNEVSNCNFHTFFDYSYCSIFFACFFGHSVPGFGSFLNYRILLSGLNKLINYRKQEFCQNYN